MNKREPNLGLDKWIKPEEAKPKKKIEKQESDPKSRDEKIDKKISKITKFDLTCSNTKCKYKKRIVKKSLTEKDKTCPRCKNEMKLK